METNIDLVYWQAHRGGGLHEAPDNTMAANRYAWGLGGIPEADIRTTKDGVIVCLHDATLARTTTAPEPIRDRLIDELAFEELREWDAGVKFDAKFAGERVPSLAEVFAEMQGKPERLIYLDLKQVDLSRLGLLIDRYGVNEQVIFAHKRQDNCVQMKAIARGVRSMLWIGGEPERIKEGYRQARDTGFRGLDQVQLHLHAAKDDLSASGPWPFALDAAFLRETLRETSAAGIDLELLPFQFEAETLALLLDLGIRWFATDEPAKFLAAVERWTKEKPALESPQ